MYVYLIFAINMKTSIKTISVFGFKLPNTNRIKECTLIPKKWRYLYVNGIYVYFPSTKVKYDITKKINCKKEYIFYQNTDVYLNDILKKAIAKKKDKQRMLKIMQKYNIYPGNAQHRILQFTCPMFKHDKLITDICVIKKNNLKFFMKHSKIRGFGGGDEDITKYIEF